MRTEEQTQPPSPDPQRVLPLYEKVFTPLMLRWLAIVSFALVVGILLYWAFQPSRLDDPMARFVASLLVATLFAVFFFVFYPDQLEMRLPEVLGTAIRLTGPIVLFIVVFWLVKTHMPTPATGKLFKVTKDGQWGGMYLGDSSTTFLKGRDGDAPPEHMLVGFPDGRRQLYGIYIIFPEKVPSIKVSLHHEGWGEELPFELTRDGDSVIDVSRAREASVTP
jgi:hypothetical protein